MGKHSQPKPVHDDKKLEEQVPVNIQRDVMTIFVSRLGNIKNINLPFHAQIRINWMNQRFESDKVTIETEGDVELNFQVVIQSSIDTGPDLLHQQFLDNPVYIALLGSPASSTTTSKKSKRSAGPKSSSKKQPAVPAETVIGGSCLDMLPILLGSDALEKTLPLQSEKQLFGSEIVTWSNLPFVNLVVQPLFEFNLEESRFPENFMYVGLEGIYNLKCSSGSVLGGFALPIFDKNEAHEQFLYQSVRWVDRPNEERKFKWANVVTSVEGCAANSEYQITEDTRDISNVMDFSDNELGKIGIAPRLEWNRLHRCLLSTHCQEYIQNHIARHKNLPIEFVLSGDEMAVKMKNKSKEAVDIPKEHLIAYPDLSRLMFPGVSSTRIATQMYTFTKKNFIERAGDKCCSVFEATQPPPKDVISLPRTGKDAKKAKAGPSSKSKTATAASKTTEAEEIIIEEESIPLETKDGLPVFLVVQISLHKPLIPKKTEDEFMFELQNLIPKRIEKPLTIKNAENAYNDYCAAIKGAHHFIVESYRDYAAKYPRNLKTDLFYKYLEDTGLISKIKDHLKESVLDYMVFKIGPPSKINLQNVFQDFLASSYIKLIEDMRLTTKNRNFGRSNLGRSAICSYPSEVGLDNLHMFACEAAEENDRDKAKFFLLKMIDMDFDSPAPWIKMTVLMMQENNIDKAEIYAKEVISIDSRHPVGLLLYAIILFLKEDFNTSEIFFHAVTTFHPNFVQAWISFYFFYWHLQMFEEAKIVLKNVEDFLSSTIIQTNNHSINDENDTSKNNSLVIDIDLQSIPTDIKNGSSDLNTDGVNGEVEPNIDNERAGSKLPSNSDVTLPKILDVTSFIGNDVLEPILSWFPDIENENCSKFLQTGISLLSLRCFMFAEMCLNKVRLLSNSDEMTVIVEYLLACCDYLSERSQNALQHLDAALCFNIQPIPLHLLAGHCHYKMENFEKMEESYSFVCDMQNGPIAFQLHLMYLRLGNIKLIQEKFLESRDFYYKSCEQIRTPLAWLGLAKACYMLESYSEAEKCLSEANLLDCENGEIWSYLAIINHRLNRPAAFLDCYNQTKRFPSNKEVLRNEIGELYYSFYESNCFINRRFTEEFDNISC